MVRGQDAANDAENTGDGLPAYASPEDPPRRSLHKGALVLVIAAVVLAIAGDVLMANQGGQAVVLLVIAAVASIAAVSLNRSSARRARNE